VVSNAGELEEAEISDVEDGAEDVGEELEGVEETRHDGFVPFVT
jgi:hypothetical protein